MVLASSVGLATIGVCVFSAATSVAALFNKKYWRGEDESTENFIGIGTGGSNGGGSRIV